MVGTFWQRLFWLSLLTAVGCSGRIRDRHAFTQDAPPRDVTPVTATTTPSLPSEPTAAKEPADAALAQLIEGLKKKPIHPMVGQRAPSFTVRGLDGEWFDLSDHVGRDVVVLDFWATWCGPCREALPKLAQVQHDFDGQHVVFYAVNVREKKKPVSKFVRARGVELPVLLDVHGEAADLYGVDGIPQTVIIGRDGRVQIIHVGYSSTMDQRLAAELDFLLDDVDVATALAAE